ncbi:MAG: WecB/TagA/CpsF family glycosyltransferase [Spirochaetia bacterium]|nr:WecB/TagA/CpsF family glycosyltransferase [Spirochaetia bacterium]
METLAIKSLLLDDVRLDFPTERQLGALISVWDHGKNHQIAFLDSAGHRRAQKVNEYASMIASADLVLPVLGSLVERASALQTSSETGARVRERLLPIPRQHIEYVEYHFLSQDEPTAAFAPYNALKVLNNLLSALELKNGSVFLLGGENATLQKAEMNLRATFPGLRIVGRAPGDYGAANEAAVVLAMQKSTPSMIIAGSHLEAGELWIPRHMCFVKSSIFFYKQSIMETLA